MTVPTLVVSGTVTLDTTERTDCVHAAIPGGSALYAAASASHTIAVRMLGTIGTDFPRSLLETLTARGVDTSPIEQLDGPTFRWHARYSADGTQRETLVRDRGVAEGRMPPVPVPPAGPHGVLLASTSPTVQRHVLELHPRAMLVALDSMAHWWHTMPEALYALLPRLDLLFVDDEECAVATGGHAAMDGARVLLARGVRAVVIKGGSRGAWLVRANGTLTHAEAVVPPAVVDTTGAGDAFAGALVATLLTGASDAEALARGCRMAARTVAAVGSPS